MLTLRAIPPRLMRRDADGGENDLMALYVERLRANWSPLDRAFASALSVGAALVNLPALGASGAWRNGWSRSEQALLLARGGHAGHLSMAARKGVHRLLNPGALPLGANPLKNKRLFASLCQAAGLAIPETFTGAPSQVGDWLADRQAVIAKPSFASKGQGVVGYCRDGERWAADGRELGDAETTAALGRTIALGGVVQERCATHPELMELSPRALPTLRIMTAVNEAGDVEACDRMIRLSAGGPRAVDNFNAGNIVAGIDPQGRIANGFRRDAGALRPVETHPSSGLALAGRPTPDLAAAIELAVRAHEAFRSGFSVIGWDVGLTDAGPRLIEGNWSPGTDILALVSGRDLGDTRLGEIYRWRLERVPSESWRSARPVQLEPRRGSPCGDRALPPGPDPAISNVRAARAR